MTASPPQVVLLAGGAGTRLRPVTGDVPKVLVPVGDRPFLELLLDQYEGTGVRDVHLCLGVHADQVLAHLARHPRPDLRITWTVEDHPLGTAGCLRLAAPALHDEFAVVVGDSLLTEPVGELTQRWHATGREAAMAVLHNAGALVPSNVAVADGLVVTYDKHAAPGSLEHVDYGVLLLRRTALGRLPDAATQDLSTLVASLVEDRELAAVEVGRRFYEIGSPRGLAELRAVVGHGPGADRVPA
ncbi:Nucleotidyl transferase [Cellulomonas flavigena DSM 20109]|uniref:Nucleotidyl transferase n=1 Tax=Cellulomonas flavigena (strain ATCC 482 / DSM 20109 / BCRC 11376 / JCM 18109 / NBRC 3775 / NCIMB 8073 / NRS 134) TaxID=446466 RepID=D5UDL2_CELFN|nr:sugar phosphate nucleotidyltransferase [Cellulomonas flavigena]ADG76468.1 Nucleotidyl transferase [Cellulomonas flavigena DSM 20109]